MKLRKIMAGIAAAAVASSTLAVAASAGCLSIPTNTDPGLIPGSGQWLVQVYNVGNAEENKPAVDYGIDLSKVTGLRFVIEGNPGDPDYADLGLTEEGAWELMFDGAIGGGVILSCNGGDIYQYDDPDDPFATESEIWSTYNWVSQNFWGCTYTDLDGNEVSTDPNTNNEDTADDNPVSAKKIGDRKYELTATGFVNPLACTTDAWDIKEIGCMQVCLSEWGSNVLPFKVVSCEVLDDAGNVMITFDEFGKATVNAPTTDTPATDAPATDAPATDAPATDAPTTGDSSKPNAGTGVEGVALVAGIAVLATGAIVVAKKRS